MARQINQLVSIATLLISACIIDGATWDEWVNDFTSNLNRDINRMVQQVNTNVARLTENIQRDVDRTLQSLPRDAQGNIISTGSSIISTSGLGGTNIVSIVDGVSRVVTSGRLPSGEPYVRDVVEKRIGDILYHNETTLNPKTGVTETFAWKLNLAIPGAKPEIITDATKDEK